MRYSLVGVLTVFALFLLTSNTVIAQTAGSITTPLKASSQRVVSPQDREDCTKQSEHPNAGTKNTADLYWKCIMEREASRKKAAKQKIADEFRLKRQKIAECRKQANEQKLHLLKRWRFIKKCVG